MSNDTFNKNARYVRSLVSFINDTKPYHSKLTTIVEENQFVDRANVGITEKLFTKIKISPTWTYNYFSSGNENLLTTPLQRVVSPAYLRSLFDVGVDEATDMASVPFAYSKKSFDGIGVNSVSVVRGGNLKKAEPLVEGIDFFQSHGSFQFQIKQTIDANGDVNPLWAETRDDNVISATISVTRSNALNTSNPNSAINKIRAIIDNIVILINGAASPELETAIDEIYDTLDEPNLPRTYENFLALVDYESFPVDVEQVKKQLENLTPSIFFGEYTDMGLRRSGNLAYSAVAAPSPVNFYLKVNNITPAVDSNHEEWFLTLVNETLQQFEVRGSLSGVIGFVVAGQSFTSSRISFNTSISPTAMPVQLGTTGVYTPAVMGNSLRLMPENEIGIAKDAPLETWNIVKVNPLAYSRPFLASNRYGNIEDANAVKGKITLLDNGLPTSTFILTRRADGFFTVKNSVDLIYNGLATVGQLYNDGKIIFKITAGTDYVFNEGDRFFVYIENKPAEIQDLSLGFGYDLDSYDMPDLVYTRPVTAGDPTINFAYDGRFIDFDYATLNLEIAQNATSGVSWRIRALPNGNPIATAKRNSTGVFDIAPPSSNPGAVDLAEGNSNVLDPVGPIYHTLDDLNPPSNATSMPPSLELFYANSFAIDYSTDNFNTITTLSETVNVGSTIDLPTHGIKFTLAPASKPYIGVKALVNGVVRTDLGGDVFSFKVLNADPYLAETPIGLTSSFIPHLHMHGDGFYKAPEASWSIEFLTNDSYRVTATRSDGESLGPWNGTISTNGVSSIEGKSFKNDFIQFTFVRNPGIGDKFLFSTYEKKPSYLVHGSVSGWSGEATIGEYFWNGKIGFKIPLPQIETYAPVAGELLPATGLVNLLYLRPDTHQCSYLFEPTSTGFMVSRSDIGVVGFVNSNGIYEDQYLKVQLLSPTTEFKIQVNSETLDLWNAQDIVFLRPRDKARLPLSNDQVFIEKTESGSFSISVKQGSSDLSQLKPITIDPRFIDTNTNSSTTLASTSPDTAILSGWLPTFSNKQDSVTSIAEFSDPTTLYRIFSAATGEPVSEILPTPTVNAPIFKWNFDFFQSYLPLDTEANIVVRGTGFDDKLRAHISESLKFLISGGPLIENFMFNDASNVVIDESSSLKVGLSFSKLGEVSIEDGPFSGFLPGYDNLKYEWEDKPQNTDPSESSTDGGSYDAGQPPDLLSLLSKYNLTAQEREDILDRWQFYLDETQDVPSTQEQWEQFWEMMQPLDGNTGDPIVSFLGSGFGIPDLGMAMDIQSSQKGVANTGFQESIFMLNKNTLTNETTAIFYSSTFAPIPTTVPGGTTYETLQTPFVVNIPVTQIEVSFSGTIAILQSMPTPNFSIWLPGQPSPQLVTATSISLGKYRFSLPQASEVKVIVT